MTASPAHDAAAADDPDGVRPSGSPAAPGSAPAPSALGSTPAPPAPGSAPSPSTPAPRRKRSAKLQLAATTLALEAFVVLFGTLVAYGLRVAPPGVLWLAGGGLAFVLLLLSGMLRRPGGYLAGTLVQIPVLASGLVLLAAPVAGAGFGALILFVIAGIFVALWVMSLRVGGRIDRERAEWDAAHPTG